MVLFGKISSSEGYNFTHENVTVWDNVMNYGCGSLQMLLVLVGVPLNIYLYCFHWQKRISWTARFYRFISIANLGLIVLESLPQGVYLLMPYYLHDNENGLRVLNEILALVSEAVWSYHKILVFMLCLMQYLYIHQPYWTILHGYKFKKLMMVALVLVIVFLTIAFILSLALSKHRLFGFSNCFEIFFAKDKTAEIITIICVQVPDYLFVLSSLFLYIITRTHLRFNTDIELTDKIRSDFRATALLVINVFLWMVVKLTSTILFYNYDDPDDIPKYESFYFVYIQNNVLPGTMATLSSIFILVNYKDVRAALFILLTKGTFDPFPYDKL